MDKELEEKLNSDSYSTSDVLDHIFKDKEHKIPKEALKGLQVKTLTNQEAAFINEEQITSQQPQKSVEVGNIIVEEPQTLEQNHEADSHEDEIKNSPQNDDREY